MDTKQNLSTADIKVEYDLNEFNCLDEVFTGNEVKLEENAEIKDEIDIETMKYDTVNYKCDKCEFATTFFCSFQVHIDGCNKINEQMKCEDVLQKTQTFTRSAKFSRNMKDNAGKITFDCDLCGKSFLRKYHLHIHGRKHSGEKPFDCQFCDRAFGHKSSLTKHVRRIHTTREPVNCEICCKTYVDIYALRNHLKFHAIEKLNTITEIEVDTSGKSVIIQTTETTRNEIHKLKEFETGQKLFECNICTKTFADVCTLQSHMRIHAAEKSFKCNVCSKVFLYNRILQDHIRTHTGEKPFKCKLCSRAFTLSRTLTKHMKIHTGEKPFDCEVCGAMFADKTNLRNHVRTHTGEKQFDCKVCGKAFTLQKTLKKHMKIHSSRESRVNCKVCSKTFIDMDTLKEHLKLHVIKKRFECKICGKCFIYRCHLRKHKIIHTGLKPFECNFCTKTFAFVRNLKIHMQIHIKKQTNTSDTITEIERNYKCNKCEFATAYSHIYQVHVDKCDKNSVLAESSDNKIGFDASIKSIIIQTEEWELNL